MVDSVRRGGCCHHGGSCVFLRVRQQRPPLSSSIRSLIFAGAPSRPTNQMGWGRTLGRAPRSISFAALPFLARAASPPSLSPRPPRPAAEICAPRGSTWCRSCRTSYSPMLPCARCARSRPPAFFWPPPPAPITSTPVVTLLGTRAPGRACEQKAHSGPRPSFDQRSAGGSRRRACKDRRRERREPPAP